MPYRSILITLVTVMLAILAYSMWMIAIAPRIPEVIASTQPSTEPGRSHPGVSFPTTASAEVEQPDRQFKDLIKATMIATFLIICLLFVIGFFATLRSWMRAPKPKRTRYVDAWKIAGERLRAADDADGAEDDAKRE
jgi:hypothetical protein